jgi:hypothetical protein
LRSQLTARMGSPPDGVVLDAGSAGIAPLTTPEMRFLCLPHQFRLYSAGEGVSSGALGAFALLLEAARPENRGTALCAMAETDQACTDTLKPRFEALDLAFAKRYGFNLLRTWNGSMAQWTTVFGSRIMLRPWGKADKLHSYEFSAMWIDGMDARFAKSYAEIEALCAKASVGTRRVIFTDRPAGQTGVHGWFARQMSAGVDVARQYGLVRAPSWTSRAVKVDDLLRWRSTLSDMDWELKVCTNLVASGKRAFPEFSRARHGTKLRPAEGETVPWVLGVDWGTTHAHVMAAWLRGEERQIIIMREIHLTECSDEDVINACARLVVDFGYWPSCAYVDGAPNAKDANRKFRAKFGTAFPTREMRTEKVIWPGVKVVRSCLAPPAGRAPRLLIADDLLDAERWPYGVCAALECSNRRVSRDGVVLDELAENHRIEHALDVLRYICVGVIGLRVDHVYSHSAVR